MAVVAVMAAFVFYRRKKLTTRQYPVLHQSRGVRGNLFFVDVPIDRGIEACADAVDKANRAAKAALDAETGNATPRNTPNSENDDNEAFFM